MRRLLSVLFPFAAAAFLSGCVKSRTLVVVKADGSGYLVFSQLATGRSGSNLQVADASDKKAKEKLSELAERFGEGVTLAKSEVIKGKGYAAVYAFTNVNNVTVPVMTFGPLGEGGFEEADEAPSVFRQSIKFEFTPGDEKRLVVRMPPALLSAAQAPAATNAPEGDAGEAKISSANSELAEAAGMELNVLVQVSGQVLRHQFSQPVAGRKDRFCLLHMEGDKLLEHPEAAKLIANEPPSLDAMDEYFAKFLQLSSAEVETNQSATVWFK
jgi:hypothetical protein